MLDEAEAFSRSEGFKVILMFAQRRSEPSAMKPQDIYVLVNTRNMPISMVNMRQDITIIKTLMKKQNVPKKGHLSHDHLSGYRPKRRQMCAFAAW